jgi:hypothetical protein
VKGSETIMLRIFRKIANVPAYIRSNYVGPIFAFEALLLTLDAKREMDAACEKQRAATETTLLRAGQPF